MKRKRLPPNDPREWISRAKSNLALARNVIPDVDLEDLCFDAQQAAEKAVKAVFIHRGEILLLYSHDLERLLHLLEGNGLKVPKYVHLAKELPAAHVKRYPRAWQPPSRKVTSSPRSTDRVGGKCAGPSGALERP